MSTRRPAIDPFLTAAKVDVEQEELLEPDIEAENPTRFQAFKFRLHHYGNRALQSAQYFVTAVRDAIVNISTALAGSILLLPFIIVIRGGYVILYNVLTSVKDVVLSVSRGILDVLRLPFQTVAKVFYTFNKQVLFPLVKRIKEDDTFAMIAFVILVALGILVYVLVRRFLLQ